MNRTVETGTRRLFDVLNRDGLAETTTVVLIGSAARDMMNGRSDIDVLVLSDNNHRIRLKRLGDGHLQQDTRSNFLRRLNEGDDYPGWALRFGIPMRDPDGWWAEQVDAERHNPHWPDWRPKLDHAKKRMSVASELLDIGDLDAASEELMFAASHVARASLLRCGKFPLSRPELPAQLNDSEPGLSHLLDQLIEGILDHDGLKAGESLLERYIKQLQEGRYDARGTSGEDRGLRE